MTTKDITITVPEQLSVYYIADNAKDELQRNAMILYPYIKNNTISHGKAAELLGISKWELIEIYDSLGMPYLSSMENYLEDLKTIADIKGMMS